MGISYDNSPLKTNFLVEQCDNLQGAHPYTSFSPPVCVAQHCCTLARQNKDAGWCILVHPTGINDRHVTLHLFTVALSAVSWPVYAMAYFLAYWHTTVSSILLDCDDAKLRVSPEALSIMHSRLRNTAW